MPAALTPTCSAAPGLAEIGEPVMAEKKAVIGVETTIDDCLQRRRQGDISALRLVAEPDVLAAYSEAYAPASCRCSLAQFEGPPGERHLRSASGTRLPIENVATAEEARHEAGSRPAKDKFRSVALHAAAEFSTAIRSLIVSASSWSCVT
jgi:hypothetical protein